MTTVVAISLAVVALAVVFGFVLVVGARLRRHAEIVDAALDRAQLEQERAQAKRDQAVWQAIRGGKG